MIPNDPPLLTSQVPGLEPVYCGKVRDVYDVGSGRLLLVATDRLSAFDYVLPTGIPGKGRVLTALSNFWFARLLPQLGVVSQASGQSVSDVVSDRIALTALEGRSVVARAATPLRLEAVVRGYVTGSGYLEYRRTGAISGVSLPPGLVDGARLGEPIFTPTTKAPKGQHDAPMTFDEVVALIGRPLATQVREVSLALYSAASRHAEARGILIADTKLEFGLIDGELALIDELLTPDSSRFWPKDRWTPGQPQQSFDKQIVRDWLLASCWDRSTPPSELPPDIVRRTALKYREVLDRLTGPARA